MYPSRDKGGADRFPSRHYKRVALCARIVSSSGLPRARTTGTAITTFVGGACLRNTTAKELSTIARTDADYPDEWSPGHQPLVFLCGHEVTGTIRIDFKPAGRAVFRLIAIDTPRQGQGLGNIMLEMAEDYARARGVDSICLNSVPDAYGFYVRHGFRRWRWEGCTSNRTEIPVMKLLPPTLGTTLARYPSLQQSALARHWSEPVC